MINALKKAALTATLLVGFTGLIGAAPAVHAAQQQSLGRCTAISCYHAPTLSTVGMYGTVYISGAYWPANTVIDIDVYMPVSAGGAVTNTWAFTDGSGKFSTAWRAPGGCFNGQVEVQAYHGATVLTSYVIPGCIG